MGRSRIPRQNLGHPDPKIIEGQLVLKGKFGFVISEKPGVPDIYVQGETLRLAMNGDRVAAKPTSTSDPARPEGEIVRIVSRARASVTGAFRKIRKATFIEPEDGREMIRVLDLKGLSPQEGDLAVIKITEWPTPKSWAGGVLIEALGSRSGPGMELKAILRKFELPDVFPQGVIAEAESFSEEVPESAWQGRETFFHIPVFTIDGADAKDFDDAVSLEELPGGEWRLGVHIADVAQYVNERSALDEESYRRGTSIYFVDKVVPMLPARLSDGLCSLRPNLVRLTLSCIMDINPQGRVIHRRIVESAIRSAQRFTYEDVEAILKGGNCAGVDDSVVDTVKRMGPLARLLRELRFKRGSLDFDLPEAIIISDDAGRPVDARRRDRLESHRLIEEFMLLANESVAAEMRQFPFLYRIHEQPDEFKMGKLDVMLKAVGVAMTPGFQQRRPAAIQNLLESVKGKPVEGMIHAMVLRSLKQAVYSPKNAGHYGLASACYTHFTSPIRRYPDLIVHRIIKERLCNKLSAQRQEYWKSALPNIGVLSSRRERSAVDAEREYLDLKKVQVMESHLGESFEGVVSSVTSFGLFVELNDFFVEGLVHVSNIRDDYYIYDEAKLRLTGRRTGRVLSMGARVRVKLAAANTTKRQLDFDLEQSSPSIGQAPNRKKFPPKNY